MLNKYSNIIHSAEEEPLIEILRFDPEIVNKTVDGYFPIHYAAKNRKLLFFKNVLP